MNSSAALASEVPLPQSRDVASKLPVFYYNSTLTAFDDAELACQRQGGHLAMYSDYLEQQLVESWMVSGGFIIPSFAGELGLAAASRTPAAKGSTLNCSAQSPGSSFFGCRLDCRAPRLLAGAEGSHLADLQGA